MTQNQLGGIFPLGLSWKALGRVLVGFVGSQVGPGGFLEQLCPTSSHFQELCRASASPAPSSTFSLQKPSGEMCALGTWGPLLRLLLQPPGFPGSSRCCPLRGCEIPPVNHLQGSPCTWNQVKIRNCFKAPSEAWWVTCTQVCAKASGDPEPPPCSSPAPQNCLVEKGMLERKEPDAGRAGMPMEQGLVLLASPRGGMGRGRGSLLPVATCFRCPGLRGACQLLSIEKWIILQSD